MNDLEKNLNKIRTKNSISSKKSLNSPNKTLELLKTEATILLIKGYTVSKIKLLIDNDLRTQYQTQIYLNCLMLNLNIFSSGEEDLKLFYDEAQRALISINKERENFLSMFPQAEMDLLPDFKELKASVEELLALKTKEEIVEILSNGAVENIIEEPKVEQKIEAIKVINLYLQTNETFYQNLNNADFKTTLEMTNHLGITCIKLLEIQAKSNSSEDNSILTENLDTFYKGFLSLMSFCNTNSFTFNSRSAFPSTFNGFAKSIKT